MAGSAVAGDMDAERVDGVPGGQPPPTLPVPRPTSRVPTRSAARCSHSPSRRRYVAVYGWPPPELTQTLLRS